MKMVPELTLANSALRIHVAPFGGSLDAVQLYMDGFWVDVCQNGLLAHANLNRRSLLIMSPHTTRVENGEYPWSEGDGFAATTKFQLNTAHHKHAIHGPAPRILWTVSARGESHFELTVESKDHADLFRTPSALTLRTRYQLVGDTELLVKHTIVNSGAYRAPIDPGSHGFNVKCPGGSMVQPTIQFVAKKLWEGRTDTGGEAIPSGKLIDTPADFDFSKPRVPDEHFDNTYGEWDGMFIARHDDIGLEFRGQDVSPEPTTNLNFWFDKNRGTYAGEPVVGIPNAFNLEALGVKTGARILAPGEEFVFSHSYRWSRF